MAEEPAINMPRTIALRLQASHMPIGEKLFFLPVSWRSIAVNVGLLLTKQKYGGLLPC